jgi:hypothetical protein
MLGCFFSMAAAIFALLGLIPFLGWLNWITTLPLAILAIIFSQSSRQRNEGGALATLGLIGGVLLLFWATFRLLIGGGAI